MTLDEAIKHAEDVADSYNDTVPDCDCAKEHRQLAEWLKDYKRLREQTDVLDKIRAEIDDEADYAYASFDEYKEDILHAEPDELSDDDFRYGLRRAIEIIDKYKAESEENADECNL